MSAFFQSTGQLINSFETVYSLHTSINALTKSLEQYGVRDVFWILPEETITQLDRYLEILLTCHSTKQDALRAVAENPIDNGLVTRAALASRELKIAGGNVGAVDIHTINMMSRIYELDKVTIRMSNRHYAK